MYRPDNWDDIEGNITYELNEKYADKGFQLLAIAQAVEAGADAILKALKREGTRVNNFHYEHLTSSHFERVPEGIDGWLVFIPDEEG